MDDSGIPTYQSIAPDVSADESMTPADCWEECAHGEACRMQLARLRGWDYDEDNTLYWMGTLAGQLGCSETCECFEGVG